MEEIKKNVLLESLVMMRAMYKAKLALSHVREEEREADMVKIMALDSLIESAHKLSRKVEKTPASAKETATSHKDGSCKNDRGG